MELADIKRQKGKWAEDCEIKVDEVCVPIEQQDGGFLQNVEATFAQGQTATIKYYYNNPDFEIDVLEIGTQWYRIRWKGTYLQGNPTDPPENEPATRGVDWDKIALGQCRHGLLVAHEQLRGLVAYDSDEGKLVRIEISKWAKFSMTGEIEKI